VCIKERHSARDVKEKDYVICVSSNRCQQKGTALLTVP
jgi:hypothetical protein